MNIIVFALLRLLVGIVDDLVVDLRFAVSIVHLRQRGVGRRGVMIDVCGILH